MSVRITDEMVDRAQEVLALATDHNRCMLGFDHTVGRYAMWDHKTGGWLEGSHGDTLSETAGYWREYVARRMLEVALRHHEAELRQHAWWCTYHYSKGICTCGGRPQQSVA
jgi:hypothetical protein